MKERCRDGCRTSLLIAGVVLVPVIFHILLLPCHPYITIHFMEMIFSTCICCSDEVSTWAKFDGHIYHGYPVIIMQKYLPFITEYGSTLY